MINAILELLYLSAAFIFLCISRHEVKNVLMVANLCQLARDHSAFITRCDTFVAGFGRYIDFLNADIRGAYYT